MVNLGGIHVVLTLKAHREWEHGCLHLDFKGCPRDAWDLGREDCLGGRAPAARPYQGAMSNRAMGLGLLQIVLTRTSPSRTVGMGPMERPSTKAIPSGDFRSGPLKRAPTKAITSGAVGAGLSLKSQTGRATRVQFQSRKVTGPRLQHMRAVAWATHSRAMGARLPGTLGSKPLPQCVRNKELGVKDDSQTLRFNVVFFVRFWTYLKPVAPFFFPFFPFWNENVYSISILPLYFGST